MVVNTINEAYEKANEFINSYEYDRESSKRAGYKIYIGENHYDYICDLGDRLEVNLATGKSINIWIKTEEEIKNENLKETVKAQALEIMKLKAKLYDMICEK